MQQKLMVLAVAGALAVPAGAFAAASSVTISGRVTYEYGYSSQGDNRPGSDISDNPGGSNIRFKGEEKLGGGLSAWFQCETSTDVRALDDGNFMCSRNSALGIKGAFGNVYFGKWDTPFKRAMNSGIVGSEATGMLGMSFIQAGGSGGAQAQDVGGTLGGWQGGPQRQRWLRRESGLNYYESPKFSGFQVLAAFSTGNAATLATNATPNAKPRVISVATTYSNGPVKAGLGYEKHKDFGAHQAGATTALDDEAWTIAAAYTFGQVELGAFFLDTEYETGPTAKTKQKRWGVGMEWRLAGPHKLSAQYVKARDASGNGGSIGGNGGVTGCGAVPNCSGTGADGYTLGYTYNFSKRTEVLLGYTYYDNDARTRAFRVGNIGSVGVNGESTSAYAMLWKHNF